MKHLKNTDLLIRSKWRRGDRGRDLLPTEQQRDSSVGNGVVDIPQPASLTGRDNILDMLEREIRDGTVYGSVISAFTTGAEDNDVCRWRSRGARVWLNGALIYERSPLDIIIILGITRDFFPVTLKQGRNVSVSRGSHTG